MNDFFKKMIGHIAALWGKWSLIQKVILAGIAAAVVGGSIALFSVSSTPNMVPVIDAPIRDENALDRIVLRLNQEGVKTSISPTGLVQVSDETTARRMRGILVREDLIPSGTDPWAIFDKERWTITDFERDINKQRAQRQMVTDHIKALDDIDNVNVEIVWPADVLFAQDQNPTTASVILTPKPGSDITQNRKKIEGIQKLLKFAVEGLKDENIVITDYYGNILNDFAGMAESDRIDLIAKQQKFIQSQETKYRADILRALQSTFSADRVRDLNIKIDMDMSKKSSESTRIDPIMIKEQTPGLAYDDSVRVESVPRSYSRSETYYEGTGYNPEGPAGVEGQTPPAFKDMSNLYGKVTQKNDVQNNELNSTKTVEEYSPKIDRVTVSVNIDGKWKMNYDEKGKPVMLPDGSMEREYTPVPQEDLDAAEALIRDAMGYDAARGYSVTVRNIQFDRSREHAEEDAGIIRKKQIQTMVIIILSGLTLLLVGFIIFRVISREMERLRRQADEERARREQALRESAMMESEQEGMDVSISVEERSRMELMESVTNLAKEHPEDCAQLIRTWLSEE